MFSPFPAFGCSTPFVELPLRKDVAPASFDRNAGEIKFPMLPMIFIPELIDRLIG
jgi:hypothetical protein